MKQSQKDACGSLMSRGSQVTTLLLEMNRTRSCGPLSAAPAEASEYLGPGGGNIDNAGIGYSCSNPLLKSDGTRNPVSSLADALNRNAFRINIRTGQRKVHYGRNY